ncbi:MAG: hypothetical protein K1X94_14835 [Sandaracinaceae bacterium]|nr:hypothetical protein [Sandaracinaceae bacterium]
MRNEELSREIERAARNRKKLAALEAENERAAKDVAALLAPPPVPTAPPPVRRHPAAVRA